MWGLVVEAIVVEEADRRRQPRRALAKDGDGASERPTSGRMQARRPWAEPKKCWESRECWGSHMDGGEDRAEGWQFVFL